MNEQNEIPERVARVLRSITSAVPPADMEARLTQRLRARQIEAEVRGRRPAFRALAWVFAAAMVLLAVSFAVVHRSHEKTVATTATLAPLPAVAPEVPAHTVSSPLSIAPAVHVPRRATPQAASSPAAQDLHDPSSFPLTSQERLLIALARTPSLAAGSAISEPIVDHGLGPSTLLDLNHEELTPLSSAALDTDAMQSSPSEPTSSGENQ